jgi:hypothetical protein
VRGREVVAGAELHRVHRLLHGAGAAEDDERGVADPLTCGRHEACDGGAAEGLGDVHRRERRPVQGVEGVALGRRSDHRETGALERAFQRRGALRRDDETGAPGAETD